MTRKARTNKRQLQDINQSVEIRNSQLKDLNGASGWFKRAWKKAKRVVSKI